MTRLEHACRTLAHQFVLFHWGRRRVCEIRLVNRPGTSTHEKGIAIDRANAGRWITVLGRHGRRHRGRPDLPHFTFVGRGINPRVMSESTRAF